MRGHPMLFMLAGPLVWTGYFTAAYAVVALACALRWPQGPATLGLAAWTTAALLGQAWLLWGSRRERTSAGRFHRDVGTALTILSMVATIWVGIPLLFTSYC